MDPIARRRLLGLAGGAAAYAAMRQSAFAAASLPPSLRAGPRQRTLLFLAGSNGSGFNSSTVLGDPTASGATAYGRPGGFGSPSTSFAGIVTNNLKTINSAWDVINVSRAGNGVYDLTSDFDSRVRPFWPSHVFFGPHPNNDAYDVNKIIDGTIFAVQKIRSIGAIPILRGAYPHNSATAQQYAAMLAINQQLSLLGEHFVDHLRPFDDGAGHYLGGSTYIAPDGLHWLDPGHLLGSRCFDYNAIEFGAPNPRVLPRIPGAWQFGAVGQADASPITVAPRAGYTSGNGIAVPGSLLGPGLASWTMRLRLRGVAGMATARALMSMGPLGYTGNPTRLRRPGTTLVLTDGPSGTDLASSSIDPGVDTAPHDYIITYNAITNVLALYVDGVLAGSGSPATPYTPFSVFCWGGRLDNLQGTPNGAAASHAQLWNVPLSAADIADIARTGVLPVPAIFDADFSMRPQQQSIAVSRTQNGMMAATFGVTGQGLTAVAPF